MSPDTVQGAAREAGDHPALEMAARIGYAVSGLLHLLIGWLALQIAWSNSGKSADQSGALASLAGNGLGQVALWVAVLGFFGLALWQVVEAVGGYFGEGMDAWAGRGKAMAKAVVYLVLGWTTLGFARGKHSSSKQQSVDFTASMLQSTAGRALVVAIGLVIIGVGVYHVHKGATKKFLRDLAEHPGAFATRAGADRLHRQGHRPGHRRPALRRGRGHPPGPGRRGHGHRPAHAARAADGPGAAHRRRDRAGGLRRVQLRPGALREGLTARPDAACGAHRAGDALAASGGSNGPDLSVVAAPP